LLLKKIISIISLIVHFTHLIDSVVVEETTPDENTIELALKVDNSDIGKVIGKRGNTVNAMRTLLTAVGAKEHHRATLKILEEDKDFKES
jgi:predicted RNA-binding protein YlqC (UPF0109 family)